MNEAFVQLQCPDCLKDWERNHAELPAPDVTVECPDCGTTRPTSEFMRTDRDVTNRQAFQAACSVGVVAAGAQSAPSDRVAVANSLRSTSPTSPTDS
jgi:ribosomal protein S27E